MHVHKSCAHCCKCGLGTALDALTVNLCLVQSSKKEPSGNYKICHKVMTDLKRAFLRLSLCSEISNHYGLFIEQERSTL